MRIPTSFASRGVASVAVVLSLLACGEESEPPTPDTTKALTSAAEASCAATAASLCARVIECSPLMVEHLYGDRAACERDVVGACRVRYRGAQAATPATCDTAALSCDRVKGVALSSILRWPGPSILGLCGVTPGSAPDAAACEGDGDCASGACSSPLCGVCVPRAPEGGECSRDEVCAAGLACFDSVGFLSVSGKGVCRKLAATGEACSDSARCAGDDISTKCRAGQCVARGRTEGETCERGGTGCDLAAGLVCTVASACERAEVSPIGRECDSVWFAEGGAACVGGSTCMTVAGATECVPVGRLREPCGDRSCAAGLRCEAGICRPVGESSCKDKRG